MWNCYISFYWLYGICTGLRKEKMCGVITWNSVDVCGYSDGCDMITSRYADRIWASYGAAWLHEGGFEGRLEKGNSTKAVWGCWKAIWSALSSFWEKITCLGYYGIEYDWKDEEGEEWNENRARQSSFGVEEDCWDVLWLRLRGDRWARWWRLASDVISYRPVLYYTSWVKMSIFVKTRLRILCVT